VTAVEWGLIQSNPADVVKPPTAAPVEIEILREAEVTMVLRGQALYPIVALALTTGMRRGELLALRWININTVGGSVRIVESLEQTKTGLRFKPPKTRYGRRTVSVPPGVMTALREHRRSQQEMRLKLGAGKLSDDALAFPDID